ncbi:Cysteine desulfurase [Candidatus Providencia siddallii]|uniref:Cysteine desulfurase n=1 Tax=Candidatus Providencia siddallii TaxID=1715285 RepID=A0A0M6W6D7_9GAMM|nr:Cysteine desulfurase [Candidatus Providencia siddallii]
MSFDVLSIKKDFPALSQCINNNHLVYLDSAASAQKPLQVIKRETEFTLYQYAAVHRGVHTLSANATTMMENVRQKTAKFINASLSEEIIFVKGTTEGINLVANSFCRKFLSDGDNIIITEMEHHANIVPWYLLAKQMNINIQVAHIYDDGKLNVDELYNLINSRTKLLCITHISNVLGTVNPIKKIIREVKTIAKIKGIHIYVLIDGAQGITHQTIDVRKIDCDFYIFSGHKLYGPTGIGILYGKKAILDEMPPWEGGGAMIQHVDLIKGITFADIPWRFEAGTPNISSIIGLGAVFDYLSSLDLQSVFEYESNLMTYASQKIKEIPNIIVYGNDHRKGVLSFNLGTYHAYDLGLLLDNYGIAIRTGHHCALPLMKHFCVSTMCRASIGMYTTKEDIDYLIKTLNRIRILLC